MCGQWLLFWLFKSGWRLRADMWPVLERAIFPLRPGMHANTGLRAPSSLHHRSLAPRMHRPCTGAPPRPHSHQRLPMRPQPASCMWRLHQLHACGLVHHSQPPGLPHQSSPRVCPTALPGCPATTSGRALPGGAQSCARSVPGLQILCPAVPFLPLPGHHLPVPALWLLRSAPCSGHCILGNSPAPGLDLGIAAVCLQSY